MNQTNKTIYFITGASGVGKTTLLEALKKKYNNKPWLFMHFDSIKVPSLSAMQMEFGSGAAWQKVKTFEWIDRLVHECDNEKIFFEGQVNLSFIREGFAEHGFANYKIILLDCSEDQMQYRLTHRSQPELFTDDMKNWLSYLRRQAKDSCTPILDTTKLLPEDLVRQFEKNMDLWPHGR